MVKPTTKTSEDHGKDSVTKAKEDLNKEESVVVITTGPPTKVKKTKGFKILGFLAIAVILLLVLMGMFAIRCRYANEDHDEEDSHEMDKHGDDGKDGIYIEWTLKRPGQGDGDSDRDGDDKDDKGDDDGDSRERPWRRD
ncbi:uncharacterized protein [Antedon mediterranea]|uniref:uncharacterized protein n=1 Tax=Antedon mediterranea TaxID=105859 RepID=UPI003AF44A9D